MRRGLLITILPLAIALGACQPGWVRLDGSHADADELQRAREVCQVDARLAELEKARAANAVDANKTDSNEAKMLQLDSFETENYRVYREIEACMREQGLRQAR
jgi:hypothetical protein